MILTRAILDGKLQGTFPELNTKIILNHSKFMKHSTIMTSTHIGIHSNIHHLASNHNEIHETFKPQLTKKLSFQSSRRLARSSLLRGCWDLLFASQDSAVWVSLLLRSSQSLPKPGRNVEGILWRLVIGKPVNHTTPTKLRLPFSWSYVSRPIQLSIVKDSRS